MMIIGYPKLLLNSHYNDITSKINGGYSVCEFRLGDTGMELCTISSSFSGGSFLDGEKEI